MSVKDKSKKPAGKRATSASASPKKRKPAAGKQPAARPKKTSLREIETLFQETFDLDALGPAFEFCVPFVELDDFALAQPKRCGCRALKKTAVVADDEARAAETG